MAKFLGIGSNGWTHRRTWQQPEHQNVTSVAVDMQEIPEATQQILRNRLTLCLTRSIEWIMMIELLEFGGVEDLFVKYFRCDALGPQDRIAKHAIAMRKFRSTRTGINGVQEVKFQPIQGKDGYVGGGRLLGKNRIHLNVQTFVGGAAIYCVEVYLHEATHKYANTNDHSYLLPGYVDAEQPYQQEITTAQALDNADSYAGFAREVTLRMNQAHLAQPVVVAAVGQQAEQ